MEYPSAHDFYCHSNTHNPDKEGFHDLYHRDFIHAISWVARRKLSRHRLDPYQCAAFQCGIVCHNIGEEEADPTLELAMEYMGALGTIIFDELCCLRDLTKAQVGRNQFTVDVAVDRLDERINEVDGRADHASERLLALEGKVTDLEEGYTELLALGREQTETSVRVCRAIVALSTIMIAQQDQLAALRERMVQAEERMDTMREMILVLEYTQENPIVVDEESEDGTAVSDGVELEVEENEVAVPIPLPGHLVPIKEAVQVLPDELVGTQIAFDLADKDHPPLYE